jgi:hypothetical protein
MNLDILPILVGPTGVNLSNSSLISNRHLPLSTNLEYQKAQSFLDILVQLRFAPLYIHKLQLRLSIDKQYYKELAQNEGRINRAKTHEEIIGRRKEALFALIQQMVQSHSQ